MARRQMRSDSGQPMPRKSRLLPDRVADEILQLEIGSLVWLPVRGDTEHRMLVAIHQAQKHLRNDPPADRPEFRRLDRYIFGDRYLDLLPEVHGFGQNVGPQWTIVLENLRHRQDVWLRPRVIDALAEQDILVVHRRDAHLLRDMLSRRKP